MQSRQPFVRFVTRKWPPAVGGMETYSARFAELLPAHCELDVIALPGRAGGLAPSPARLLLFGIRTFLALLFARRAADVTHVADMASWPLALAARIRAPRRTVVLSAHGTDVSYGFRPGFRSRAYRAYLAACRRLLPRAVIVANSAATSRALQRLGFSEPHVVPLAADRVGATPPNAPMPHLLFAGRLIRRKGLSWFVAEVLDRLPDQVSLHVAGPVWDKSEADCLNHERVNYLGTLPPDRLRVAYRQASCVIIPNLDMDIGHLEGFGLVAPEAAAAGAVVLGSDTGGLSDAILDGQTGYLLPAGDAAAWAAKIDEVLAWAPDRRRAFVAASREICGRHFSWERVVRQTFALYGVSNRSPEGPRR